MRGTIHAADIEIGLDGVDPDVARAILAARAATLDMLAAPMATSGPAMLVWMLAGERFALPLDAVLTVLPPLRITPVPGASRALAGIAHWRGGIVNIVDPGGALGLADAAEDGHLLLLRRPGPRIALRVDRCAGVVRLAHNTMRGEGIAAEIEDETGAPLNVVDGDRMIAALGFGAPPVSKGE